MLATVNDISIHYELEGPEGAPVITFSNSLAATLELWEFQVPVLRGAYRILRCDTRGHGRSSAPPGPYTMEMLAADVVGLLDFLHIERTHFVGISMGGMIGQVLAAHAPQRLEKLVLCDTNPRVPPEAGPVWDQRIRQAETEGMASLAGQTLERWLSEEYRRNHPETTARIREMIVCTPVSGYAGCGRAIAGFDAWDELPKISARTLVVVGEKDEGSPVSAAEAIHRRIARSELVVVPGALHLPIIERVESFNDALLRFLG
ncbi:MAG: 3-oxoadipate enol-lactonase [Syntrophobacteraceae bacterium]|nr:3-oxoadipate enol-lactonase [Desulfobacteraceae bacterium]